MSNFAAFMKKNKKQKPNTKYPATKSLTDEKGDPLLWTIRPLTTAQNEAIRESCMYEVQVPGKKNQYRYQINSAKYIVKMLVASVVEPDLNNAELQDSYDVHGAEDLLKEMIDSPGEYNDFVQFVQDFNGFDATLQDETEKAKN